MQAHCQHIAVAPVNQVQVEIVLEFRSIEHFVRDPGNLPEGLLGGGQQLLAFPAEWIVECQFKE